MKVLMADYGVGNIHSIKKALEIAGAEVEVTSDLSRLPGAQCVVLPGVGAFDAVMRNLAPVREELRQKFEAGLPALTVCIGTHVMFSGSDEGELEGISAYGGRVRLLKSRTVPHMGWNEVVTSDPIMEGISERKFYFAHSYYCDADPKVVKGTTEYEGFTFPTLMRDHNVVSTQFHPEKSSAEGQRFLRNFVEFAEGQI